MTEPGKVGFELRPSGLRDWGWGYVGVGVGAVGEAFLEISGVLGMAMG